MALALVLFGAILLVAAIRGTYGQLGKLLAGDFTGPNNFLYWIAAVGILGALGYIPTLQTPTRALLGLIIVAFALKNGTGFFSNLQSALAGAKPASVPASDTVASEAPTGPLPISLSGGSSNPTSNVSNVIPLLSGLAIGG